MKHDAKHPLSGQTVKVNLKLADGSIKLEEYRLEDWWDHLTGQSWMNSNGNPAALMYAMRNGIVGLPLDDEVVYGKIGSLGHLVHVSEIVA